MWKKQDTFWKLLITESKNELNHNVMSCYVMCIVTRNRSLAVNR